MRDDPAQLTTAQDCAAQVGLSFSRFLHLFKAEVGTPFRSFRTWKRARSLLHYVNREANLARVTLQEASKLNTLDLVQYGRIVVSTKALETIIARANGGQS